MYTWLGAKVFWLINLPVLEPTAEERAEEPAGTWQFFSIGFLLWAESVQGQGRKKFLFFIFFDKIKQKGEIRTPVCCGEPMHSRKCPDGCRHAAGGLHGNPASSCLADTQAAQQDSFWGG